MQTKHKNLPLTYRLRSLFPSRTLNKQVNKKIANNLSKIKENANKSKTSNYIPYKIALYTKDKEAKAKEAKAKAKANVAAEHEANKQQGPQTDANAATSSNTYEKRRAQESEEDRAAANAA